MEHAIGAVEAKAQLSRRLQAVEQGKQFTITVRGRPVADLVPHRATSREGLAATIAALQAFPRIQGIGNWEVASFVVKGRL